MKMLHHYLKYDLLVWRRLIMLLWGMVPVYVALMAVISGWQRPDDKVEAIRYAAHMVFTFGAMTFGILCLLAGGTDSTARAQTWLMTRPRRGWARFGSRSLIILGGAVLPVLMAWWGTLLVMNFDAATIAMELPGLLGTTLAIALALALLALANLCLPGVVLGVLAGCLLMVPGLLPVLKPLLRYYHGDPATLTVIAACITGTLPGLRGVWRRLTRRSWALAGLASGFTGMVALLVYIPVQNWLRFPQGSVEFVQLRNLEEWHLPLSEMKRPAVTQDVHDRHLIQIPLGPDERFTERARQGWEVGAFAWRVDARSQWSPWIRQEISFTPDPEGAMVFLECEPGQVSDMTGGELRLLVWLPPEVRTIPLPTAPLTQMSGPGWNLEILPPIVDGNTVVLEYVERHLSGHGRLAQVHCGGPNRANLSDSVRMSSAQTAWVRISYGRRATTPGTAESRSHSAVLPDALVVEIPAEPRAKRILRFSGVTIHPPPRKGGLAPASPPQKSIWPVLELKSPGWANQYPARSPEPLTDTRFPEVPSPEAPEAEIARYLHQLGEIARQRLSVNGMAVVLRAAQFAPLLPRSLPLVVRLVEHLQYLTPTVVLTVLKDLTPEERRAEIIGRLPFAPVLMRVVEHRGWLAEARRYVIQTVLRDQQIPSGWEHIVADYREPVLTAVLRRLWTPTEYGVRLWESVPDLAVELPVKLAEMREYVRGIGSEPDARDDAVIEALIYAGDPVGLDALLHLIRAESRFGGFPGIAWRFLRKADGKTIPHDESTLRTFLGESTAADFRFDPVPRLWTRNPAQP